MLSRVDALQAAARRYCSERAELWLGPFFSRGGSLAQRSTWARWDEELETYRARLRALDAIGGALPASTPAESASLEEARELLLLTAASAVDELLQTSDHSRFERRVIHEEERLFADYLRGLSDAELTRVEHPPFRRHLSERESARLWAELKARWGVEQGRVWFPHDRSENDEPPFDTHVFDADPFLEKQLHDQLRGVLAALGVTRLWELRGLGGHPGYELELAAWPKPVSTDLNEMYWTDASFEWLIYASHEETVTIVGAELLSRLQVSWPAWRSFVPDWAESSD